MSGNIKKTLKIYKLQIIKVVVFFVYLMTIKFLN